MEQITQEMVSLARKAVEADKWEDFFDAFDFKIHGDIKDCREKELEAIRKWVLWSYNYSEPRKFIREIWGEGHFADHIYEKFIQYNANMNRFYAELDNENKRKLAEYVLNNYNPG